MENSFHIFFYQKYFLFVNIVLISDIFSATLAQHLANIG